MNITNSKLKEEYLKLEFMLSKVSNLTFLNI